ncbi:MAG: MBL fold metallo-hydrolase [Chloroflexi bacterium]|nr:MBL fold metallo-hydrolase [Chloroflexota bacterium]
MVLQLAFHGAAGTVTGSRFLLSHDDGELLVDCGLFQGLKDLRLRNWAPPSFDVRRLDAVVLTHAHIDHSGYLPRLVRDGYRGPVYCTPATAELAEVLLLDAARLQEEDADYANRKGFSKHHPALPLFTERDAENALRHLRPVSYHQWFEPAGLRVRFRQAGHILGAASVEALAPGDDGATTIVFSGDLGRYDAPLHLDPEPLPKCDTLVLDSTYGDRLHDPATLEEQLRGPLLAAIRRRATILIPAFAVARAQVVTLLLRKLMDEHKLPEIPIHVDSPMAVDVTRIYNRHLGRHELDGDAATRPGGPLFPHTVSFHRTVEESQRLNDLPGPRIIISSSGMLTGGRVLHHLRRHLANPDSLIVLVGYQAAGTRGRALMEGAPTLRMHGEDIPVRCHWVSIEGLSAHADRDGILDWVRTAPRPPQTVFLAHGEPSATAMLGDRLRAMKARTIAPKLGDRYAFVPGSRTWRSAGRD